VLIALLVLILCALLLVAVALVSPETAGAILYCGIVAVWYAFCLAAFLAVVGGIILLSQMK
jgi:hypothetical protein